MRGREWSGWLIGGWLILYAGAIDAVPLLVLTDREPPVAAEWAYALHRSAVRSFVLRTSAGEPNLWASRVLPAALRDALWFS